LATIEETLAPQAGELSGSTAHDSAAAHDHSHDHSHPAPTLNPELARSIDVDAPAEDVSKAFSKATRRYSKMARIPGFRAGKVPESMVRSRFAKELRQEVLESLVNEKFRAALDAQHLQPISQPQVTELQLEEGKPLRFKATFEVMPEIAVEGYDTVSATRPETALTDEEFAAEMDNVLDHHATVEPIEEDRALADGDFAEITFTGKVQELAQTVGEDGLQSDDAPAPISGEDVLLEVGGKNTLPAFTEALRGAKVGQELEFEATYPADFGDARLAGQTVSYDVTVKALKKKTFPERNDAFAKELGNYDSWVDFETKNREYATRRKSEALMGRAREEMIEAMVAKFHFPVPETFVQNQIDARLERGLRALAQQGMTPDAMRQLDFSRLREAQRDEAVKEVKASILLDRIGDKEEISVTDSELDRELMMLSLQAREPYEQLRKRLTEDGSVQRIREQMRREKTAQQLFERLAK
jgi:trigger factor